MFLSKKTFEAHDTRDKEQFEAITSALRTHDKNVDEKHKENQASIADVKKDIGTLSDSVNEIMKLRPAIEAGIAADVAEAKAQAEVDYRKKMFRRVVAAILTTAVTVGGLIPLVQFLMTLHFHIGLT